MSRPRKRRRVRFVPDIKYFVPPEIPENMIKENILTFEELEALRLRDIEELDQESCAIKMNISRQTYQRILTDARHKIADSLVSGKAIRIDGGNFDIHAGRVKCLQCCHAWIESFDSFRDIGKGIFTCPYCQSNDIVCLDKRGYKYCRSRHCSQYCLKSGEL